MAETTNQEQHLSKADQWRARIAEQAHSGLTVKEFCKQQGVSDHSFYFWRKRLRDDQPVRFALVDREVIYRDGMGAGLEVILTGGERLRIGAGVDAAMLRMVLTVLRA
jgi:hypothetical protein